MKIELDKREGSKEGNSYVGLSVHANQKGIMVKKNH